MNFKTPKGEKLVITSAIRTPVGQAGKSLADLPTAELSTRITEEIFKRTKISKSHVDGVVAAECAQSMTAPNVARVISVKANLPLEATAITVMNNCVSGFEAITDSARRILLEEGNLYLALGMESMSRAPFIIEGAKENKKTDTVEKLKANWAEAPSLGVNVIDSIEAGLTDPIRLLNMAMTGEVVAQIYGLRKNELDVYAHGSYKKAHDAILAGKYKPYQMIVDLGNGEKLEDDEYIMSKVGMVENPGRFEKASPIFDSKYMSLKEFYEKYGSYIGKSYKEGESEAAVSLFNACPRSDGAGGLILTTESKAKELGLKPEAYLVGWGMYGVDPAVMGIGMAHALKKAIFAAGLKFEDIGNFEIHEAFAATALGTMREIKKTYNFDLEKALAEGKVNPNGGTLALGHPLGATGIRVLINQLIALKENPSIKYSSGVICAGGGVGGAIVLERA